MESNSLDVTDYLILGSITKGITKYTNIFKNCKKTNAGKFKDHVNKLEMSYVTDEKDALRRLDEAVANGWEGYMIRNADAPYEGKRTRALLKMKKCTMLNML